MCTDAFSDFEVYNINSCSNSCPALKEHEAFKVKYDSQIIELNNVNFSLENHKRGLGVLEEQLAFYKQNESNFTEDIAVLKRDLEHKDAQISMLKYDLDKLRE